MKNIDKLYFMKIFKNYTTEDTTSRIKMKTTELVKIFANYISDTGLRYRICRKPLKVNNRKPTIRLKKQTKDLDISTKKIYNK